MLFDALDKDGTERTCMTNIFAGSAAQAAFGINHGYARCISVGIFFSYHLYCSVGAVTFAVVACYPVFVCYAVVGYPYGCAYLCRAFLFGSDGFYRAVGTYVGTGCACLTAKATFERHFGLHKSVDVSRWS